MMAQDTGEQVTFEFPAAYNWAVTAEVGGPGMVGRSSTITGSGQWRFSDGRIGNRNRKCN